MKDMKYKEAWDYLETCLIKGIEVPSEVLYTIYELVEEYYEEKD